MGGWVGGREVPPRVGVFLPCQHAPDQTFSWQERKEAPYPSPLHTPYLLSTPLAFSPHPLPPLHTLYLLSTHLIFSPPHTLPPLHTPYLLSTHTLPPLHTPYLFSTHLTFSYFPFLSWTLNNFLSLQFFNFLFSKRNSIFKDSCAELYMDMDRPLCHYWVASSHNT